MTLANIREQRTAKVAEARQLIDVATAENRQLTADEAARFDAIKAEVKRSGAGQKLAFEAALDALGVIPKR